MLIVFFFGWLWLSQLLLLLKMVVMMMMVVVVSLQCLCCFYWCWYEDGDDRDGDHAAVVAAVGPGSGGYSSSPVQRAPTGHAYLGSPTNCRPKLLNLKPMIGSCGAFSIKDVWLRRVMP